MLTVTEDFLLLMLDETTGRPRLDSSSLPLGLAGGVLLDLSLAGRITVPERGAPDAGRVVVVPGPPLGHPVLDGGLAILAKDTPRKPDTVVTRLSKDLREAVAGALEARGLVRRETRRVLGIFPSTTWTPVSPMAGHAVRERLWATLVVGQDPDAPTAALVALLLATDSLHKALPGQDKRALKQRAKQVAEGSWAADSVRKAISAVQTAILASVMVATTAATTTSSS
ncbi:hypothetical protein Sked_14460 [Sanguibacter keddieii DSM 10542]|uniref:Golgi phosphoprotein 3 (GPP34) n=1 Tax=Sanguibacter keddieii (strain ATCC 51767 / DSM 10542 / NCFB 3025 / ST-74) TaxID=446469 RepID=D1BF86_SANKS|nr:GPP34 family phosphoprotein [Sanguibacter keddieii]ACZ21382.1 hypothetical protein Sked_14460 [Sanguibacter keddieii DSM 10542]